MVKYKQQVKDMLEVHEEIFASFRQVHDDYAQDAKTHKKQFNDDGQDVLRIIQKWENMLCGKTESGKYGKFSSQLSDKFWGEIRAMFPKIDEIGSLD